MKTLSIYLIVKNEESVIKRCIDSIISFSDEIIITDTGSTDKTKEIIKNINNPKIKLYDFEWCDDFSKARNFSLDKTTSEYVLTTDADEVFEESLQNEILYFKTNNFFNFDKIYIPLVNFDESQKESELFYYDSRSIIKKSKKPYWINPVHEYLKTKDKNIVSSKLTKGKILHKKHGGAKSQYNKYKEIFLKSITENFNPTNFDAAYFYYFDVTMLWNDIPLSKYLLRYCFDYRLLETSYDFRTILLMENRISENEFYALSQINDPSIKNDKYKIALLFDKMQCSEDNDYAKYIAFEFFKENRSNDLFKPYLEDVYKYLAKKELEYNFIKDYIETSELLYQINKNEILDYKNVISLKDFINNSMAIIKSDSCSSSLIYYANRYFNDICVISKYNNIPSFCKTANSIEDALSKSNKKTLVIETESQFFSEDFRKIYEYFKASENNTITIF